MNRNVGVALQQDKIKIDLSGLSETLLFPLWGRAKLSKECSWLFNDVRATEIVEKIDYDFSKFDKILWGCRFDRTALKNSLPPLFALRAKQFDHKIQSYVAEHPRSSVVNIGAGLDTTFYRVDNGLIHWYDLDLPPVIEIRSQLLPEANTTKGIAKSLLDPSWCTCIKQTEDGVFMIMGGVLMYFEEAQVKQFFSMLADNFPSGEIVFDAPSKLDNNFGTWVKQLSLDQRKELKAARVKALKGWWQNNPENQKDKLLAALKTPTKPRSAEWPDLLAWWCQLDGKEKKAARNDFKAFFHLGLRKWALDDATKITQWDKRITVIDQFPLYRNIPRDPSWSTLIRRFMDYSDRYKMSNIFHLRV